EGRGYPLGILLYPLAVLGLVLVFRHEPWMAAAVWGVLAYGDGMATVVGQGLGARALPWNPKKSWAGLAAFVVFGVAGASVLMGWTLRLPPGSWASPFILGVTVPLVLVCAAVESMPTTLDDNLTVPLAGAVVLPLLAGVDVTALVGQPDLMRRLLLGVGVNAAISAAAMRARAIDLPGA